jgi:hypothetical protein
MGRISRMRDDGPGAIPDGAGSQVIRVKAFISPPSSQMAANTNSGVLAKKENSDELSG